MKFLRKAGKHEEEMKTIRYKGEQISVQQLADELQRFEKKFEFTEGEKPTPDSILCSSYGYYFGGRSLPISKMDAREILRRFNEIYRLINAERILIPAKPEKRVLRKKK